MYKIIQEQIIRTETVPLTEVDLQRLIKRKNDLSLLAISGYIIISLICLYIWLSKPSSNNVDNKSFRVFFTSSDKEVYQESILYASIVTFLIVTFLFIKFLLKSLIPLIKDIRRREKSIIYFFPIKTIDGEPFSYYISTPLTKTPKIEVSKEEFESLTEKEVLILETTQFSTFFLRLNKGHKEIKYY